MTTLILALARWRHPSGARVVLTADGRLLRAGPSGTYTLVTRPCSLRLAEVYVRQRGLGWRRIQAEATGGAYEPRTLQLDPVPLQSNAHAGCLLTACGLWLLRATTTKAEDEAQRAENVEKYRDRLFVEGRRIFEPGAFRPTRKEGERHGCQKTATV